MTELPGDVLQSAGYRSLESRWICQELAYLAKIRRVDSDTGRQLVGRRDQGAYEGLTMPYFSLVTPIFATGDFVAITPTLSTGAGHQRSATSTCLRPGDTQKMEEYRRQLEAGR
jgi:hypothetical protein